MMIYVSFHLPEQSSTHTTGYPITDPHYLPCLSLPRSKRVYNVVHDNIIPI